MIDPKTRQSLAQLGGEQTVTLAQLVNEASKLAQPDRLRWAQVYYDQGWPVVGDAITLSGRGVEALLADVRARVYPPSGLPLNVLARAHSADELVHRLFVDGESARSELVRWLLSAQREALAALVTITPLPR